MTGIVFKLMACGGTVSPLVTLTLTSDVVDEEDFLVTPEGELRENTEVTITAPLKSDSTFAHWYDTLAEEIFSIEREHTFIIEKDMTLAAIYMDNDHFGTPTGTLYYETGFESGAGKTGYAEGTMESDGLDWLLIQVLRGSLSGDIKTGNYALRGRALGEARPLFTFADLEGIVFDYAHASFVGTGEGELSVEISADGETWVEIMAPRSPHYKLSTVRLLINYDHPALRDASIERGDALHVRFLFGGSDVDEDNATRLNLDNVKIYRFAE